MSAEAPQEGVLTVQSSHGHFTIDGNTGDVLSRQVQDEALQRLVRFDLAEWHNYYGGPPGPDLDILDLGYWLDSGTYEPPAHDWRRWFVATFGQPRTKATNREKQHERLLPPNDDSPSPGSGSF
jgi:hypothetical protein